MLIESSVSRASSWHAYNSWMRRLPSCLAKRLTNWLRSKALVRFNSMLSSAKLDSLFSVIVDRKYLIPFVCLDPKCFSFCAVPPFKWNRCQSYFHARARAGGGVTRLASCAAFTCTRTLEIFCHKCPMSHNIYFKTKLPTGVATRVARHFSEVAAATPCQPVEPPLSPRHLDTKMTLWKESDAEWNMCVRNKSIVQ